MNRTDAAREVKSRYAEYLRPAKKRNTFVCPLCRNGTGTDGDGMSIDPKGDGTRLHCFKCGFHGDIVDLYQKEHDCDTGAAFKALYEYFGITLDAGTSGRTDRTQGTAKGNNPPAQQMPAEGRTEALTGGQELDYTGYYRECREHITEPAAQAYLTFRGLSNETAARYWIGYDKATGFLIIPAASSFYIARNTDPAAKMRYKNPAGASITLFNVKALYNDAGRPVFITEGAIDALSIIEAGGEAVALNSASNTRKLLEQIASERTRSTLVLCLDKDDAGRKATAALAEGLRGQNVPFIEADITGEHKDANEALTADRAAFLEAVGIAERKTARPDNAADYIRQQMAGEIEALKKYAGRCTGFPNLDAQAGGIYPGLYTVGGISSVGKTTFVHQIADQMAAQGQHVLFFSMEQSRLEMVSKSISRLTAEKDAETAVSAIQIRQGYLPGHVLDAADEYTRTIGERLSVIEGNFSCNASFIGEYAKKYIESNGVKPVIIVDYLQTVQAETDPETGRKPADTRAITDYNITAFKRMSRTLETPVFVISSLNRGNYLTPIDFEAFKESGNIEYTSDVVWGLQLSAIHDPLFIENKDKEKTAEKRERIAEAKEAIPRDVELVCLKNRYGKSRYSVNFTYYPQFDYFLPHDDMGAGY